MAPAASTTDVSPARPAHCAFAVRHVQVTPAADAREPGRWHQTQPRARGRNAPARAELLTPHVAAVRWGRARTAAGRTHTHERKDAIRWKCTITRTCAHEHTRTRTDTRARTQMNTNTQMSTRANTRTHTLLAHARAPKKPVEDPVPPQYSLVPPRYHLVFLGNPRRTPPYRVGTASVPRRHRVGTARALCRVPAECLSIVA